MGMLNVVMLEANMDVDLDADIDLDGNMVRLNLIR